MPKHGIFSFDAALTTGGGRHEHRSVDLDSSSAVWGWFRFEPVGGGTKIKVVLLICPDRLRW